MKFSGVVVPKFSLEFKYLLSFSKLRRRISYFPEKYKVLKHGECYIKAIKKSISQEENEVFVVGKINAIVDPVNII